MADPADVLVPGPVSWNEILLVEALPEARPHTVFAQASYDALGGTSASRPGLDAWPRSWAHGAATAAVCTLGADGADLGAAMTVGARQATRALTSRHLSALVPD